MSLEAPPQLMSCLETLKPTANSKAVTIVHIISVVDCCREAAVEGLRASCCSRYFDTARKMRSTSMTPIGMNKMTIITMFVVICASRLRVSTPVRSIVHSGIV